MHVKQEQGGRRLPTFTMSWKQSLRHIWLGFFGFRAYVVGTSALGLRLRALALDFGPLEFGSLQKQGGTPWRSHKPEKISRKMDSESI